MYSFNSIVVRFKRTRLEATCLAQALGVSEAAVSQWFGLKETSVSDAWHSHGLLIVAIPYTVRLYVLPCKAGRVVRGLSVCKAGLQPGH